MRASIAPGSKPAKFSLQIITKSCLIEIFIGNIRGRKILCSAFEIDVTQSV